MWAKCGQKSSPRSPLPQRENGPDRQVGRLGLSRLRCRAGPNCAWWSCGEVEALFDGADADERAGEDAERVERGHYRVHVSPAPCGADRTDEQGECGQDDEAQPFEDVVCISSSRCFVFSHVFFSGLGSCMHFPYFSGCAEVFLPNMRASLTRRLWPVNSRSRPWCTMRSMIAAASLSVFRQINLRVVTS